VKFEAVTGPSFRSASPYEEFDLDPSCSELTTGRRPTLSDSITHNPDMVD